MEKQIDAIILLLQEICNHLEKSCAGVTITIGFVDRGYIDVLANDSERFLVTSAAEDL